MSHTRTHALVTERLQAAAAPAAAPAPKGKPGGGGGKAPAPAGKAPGKAAPPPPDRAGGGGGGEEEDDADDGRCQFCEGCGPGATEQQLDLHYWQVRVLLIGLCVGYAEEEMKRLSNSKVVSCIFLSAVFNVRSYFYL